MAWSPFKDSVIQFVSRNPGCSKMDVARYCTSNPRRNPSRQYYIVNTALRNGWIVGVWNSGRWKLYVPDKAMKDDILYG